MAESTHGMSWWVAMNREEQGGDHNALEGMDAALLHQNQSLV
jgi:hypothetical protein